jgi:hypothetical protein
MTNNELWKENIRCWRALPMEERRRRHLLEIPRHVANTMAMEGEPVPACWVEALEAVIRRALEQGSVDDGFAALRVSLTSGALRESLEINVAYQQGDPAEAAFSDTREKPGPAQ